MSRKACGNRLGLYQQLTSALILYHSLWWQSHPPSLVPSLSPPPPMAQEDTRSFWPMPCVLGHLAVASASCFPKPAENSAPGMDCGVSEGALGLSPAGLSPQLHSVSSAPPIPCLCPWARPEPALEALPAVLMSPLAPADALPSPSWRPVWTPAPPHAEASPDITPVLFFFPDNCDIKCLPGLALLPTDRWGCGVVLDNCVV